MLRLGVLASGSGSNLQAILDACAQKRIDAEVAVVLCNVKGAKALERAKDSGVEGVLLDHKAFASREAFDEAAVKVLKDRGVELVCLAGFMRLLTPTFIRAFPLRILNIHPSLLPAFPGMHSARQAFEAGVRFAGCTVHFVDEGTDTGPIVIQAVVPVRPEDDAESLAKRILEQEHVVYPRAIDLVAKGKVRVEGKRVVVDEAGVPAGAMRNPE